jgi:transcriptional regulator with XRE-family HTH domain
MTPLDTPADRRAARKKLGLTQGKLSDALHMGTWGYQAISAWEREGFDGEINPKVIMALRYLLGDPPP